MGLEQEVKFALESFARIRSRLAGLGAARVSRVFERNTVLDDAERSLTTRGRLLRVRFDAGWTLTFKAPVQGDEARPGFKVRRETETRVDDGEALLGVLAGLGFNPVLRYEKVRETWRSGAVNVCLDLLPFGRFAELEGPPGDIASLAVELGFDMDEALTGTYHDLNPGRDGQSPDFVFDATRRETARTKHGLAMLMQDGGEPENGTDAS